MQKDAPLFKKQNQTTTPCYEIRHGDLFWGDKHIADGSQTFAVMLLIGEESTSILKHGHTQKVCDYAKQAEENFFSKMPPDLRDDHETLILPVHPEIIKEINACIACTGRAGRLKEFLADLHEKHPEISIHPLALTP